MGVRGPELDSECQTKQRCRDHAQGLPTREIRAIDIDMIRKRHIVDVELGNGRTLQDLHAPNKEAPVITVWVERAVHKFRGDLEPILCEVLALNFRKDRAPELVPAIG